MDTMSAFSMGLAYMGKERKVFDWDKAADLIIAKGIKNASAGLQLDLEWTAGTILKDGKAVKDDYCYLASTWATPVLINLDQYEEIPCFIMESETKYDEHTMWPKSAKEKLERSLKK